MFLRILDLAVPEERPTAKLILLSCEAWIQVGDVVLFLFTFYNRLLCSSVLNFSGAM